MWEKTVTCDVRTTQCEDEIVKCEKKVREPPNVRKELSHVMLNCTMWGWKCQVWEKSKGTTQCDKRIVTCDVRTA